MAHKAALMRDVFYKVVKSDEPSTLKDQLVAFKEVLMHDMDEAQFADVYAQTVAYGLFTAKLHDESKNDFSRGEALTLIPKTNPFLQKLFQYVAGADIDDRVIWIVDALCEVYRAADMNAILKNFGIETGRRDPILHFYETFLAEYDPKLRKGLLADKDYPLSNLRKAEIIVLAPTAPIEERRKNLDGLSPDLPDNYILAEGVYSGLLSEKWIISKVWPTFSTLATFLADEELRQRRMERAYRAPVSEGVKVETTDEGMLLIVLRFYQIPAIEGGMHEANITTTIRLPRIAANIGYGRPEVSVEVEPRGRRK